MAALGDTASSRDVVLHIVKARNIAVLSHDGALHTVTVLGDTGSSHDVVLHIAKAQHRRLVA